MTEPKEENVSTDPKVAEAQATKYLAEAKKLQAEADATRLREARDAELHQLVLTRARSELDLVSYSEREQLLHIEHVERVAAQYAASDARHHVYRFLDQVSPDSVQRCVETISEWSRVQPGCEIEIIFSSPGGSIIHGMALYDFLLDIRKRGHKLTTGAQGYAASMAGVLLQAGEVRYLGRNSSILIHEATSIAWGKTGQIEDELEFVKKLQDRILEIFAERSGGKTTVAYLKAHWKRKDWWLIGDEALGIGLIDEIR